MFRNTTLALLLAASLMGCPKKGPDLNSPVETFNEGVRLLQTETGDVDYGAAYAMFEASITADPNQAKAQYNAGWTAEQCARVFAGAEIKASRQLLIESD